MPLVERGYLLLTPNQRLARRIKAQWDAGQRRQGRNTWAPLAVYQLEQWLISRWQQAVELGVLPAQVLISEGMEHELWRRAISEEAERSGDYQLLNSDSAARLACHSRSNSQRWQLDTNNTLVRQQFNFDTDCATYLRWLDNVDQRLSDGNLLTPTDAVAALIGVANKLPSTGIALLEFEDMAPLYRTAVDGLSDEVLELRSELGQAQCLAHAYADPRTEMASVARWARRVNQAEPGATIGIVLQDMARERTPMEYLLRREFNCLGDNYHSLPVNFSTGITLERAPLVRDALTILRLALPEVQLADVVAILQSRFAQLPEPSTAGTTQLIEALYAIGRDRLATTDLRHLVARVAKQVDQQGQRLPVSDYLLAMARNRQLHKAALPSVWVGRFCELLKGWGWPGPGPLDSLEHQQLCLWYDTLEVLAGFDRVCEPLSLQSAIALWCQCLSQQVSQPQSADSPVQVLGVLEAAGLSFDHLWLSGMQAGRWPAAAAPDPFIPVSLQRKYAMPHASAIAQWAHAQGLMHQFKSSTHTIRASYARQIDGVPEMPSALLTSFDWLSEQQDQEASASVIDPAWQAAFQQCDREPLADQWAPAVSAAEAENLGGGSALVEDQSQCPFRAFARRRLKAEPMTEVSVGLTAAERGSVLHSSLYALFKQLPDSAQLLLLGPDASLALINSAVDVALADIPLSGPGAMGRAWRELERSRLSVLLQEWLAVECQRAQHSPFTVIQLEQQLRLTVSGLSLTLRVDRIDRLPDGQTVIIDYKSGRCSVGDWLGERPQRPQLLLYGLAVEQLPAALAFARVRVGECKYIGAGDQSIAVGISTDIPGLIRGGSGFEDWPQLNEAWQQRLQQLVADFIDGQAVVDPLPGACSYCGLQPLCRVEQSG